MCGVAGGKRAGTRRAEKSGGNALTTLGYALAITACVVAWGYLVYLAIEFGSTARHGDSGAWWLLVLATLGAVGCLFVGILVGSRLAHALGTQSRSTATPAGSGPSHASDSAHGSTPPRVAGGRRALR